MRVLEKVFEYTIYTSLCFVVFYQLVIPKVIESRAGDLDLMRYDSTKDEMVPKDSLRLDKFDFYYLKNGELNEY